MTKTLIRNGNLLDCTGSGIQKNGAVLIEDEKITFAGVEKDLKAPEGEIVEVDAMGGTILPGFIDCHVHLMMESYDMEKMVSTPFSYNFFQAIDFIRKTIENGVTTVRDAGGLDLGTKMAIEKGLIVGPRTQISVNALSITGGHGDSWSPSGIDLGQNSSYPGMPSAICDGVSDVRKKTREILRAGAEVIKICSTGGVLSPTDRPEYTQFSPEELAAIVQEGAFRGGIKVMSHAQGLEGIRQAVLAGIHSIEHGIFLDDELIALMIEKGTYLVPTLYAPVSIIESKEMKEKLPPFMFQKAADVVEIHHNSIAQAYKAGVKIAMGTDAGVMPHGNNLRELSLMCDVGLTPMESILATTKVAAECLGWDKKIGTLESGKLADVVITAENPLENIQSLQDKEKIKLVMKGGKIIKDRR